MANAAMEAAALVRDDMVSAAYPVRATWRAVMAVREIDRRCEHVCLAGNRSVARIGMGCGASKNRHKTK